MKMNNLLKYLKFLYNKEKRDFIKYLMVEIPIKIGNGYTIKKVNIPYYLKNELPFATDDDDLCLYCKINFGDDVIGVINFNVISGNGDIYIRDFVIEDYKKGTGTKVFKSFIDFLKYHEFENIYLEAKKSRRFWEKLGFEKIGVQNDNDYMTMII